MVATRRSLARCLLGVVAAWPAPALERKADLVVVEKAIRKLTLFRDGKALKTYRVALGGNPAGPKRRRGDQKTPEGDYVIDGRYGKSQFHMALHISYPNPEDRRHARTAGVDPGDAILIYGLPNGQGAVGPAHRLTDWTLGCIAVTNAEMEEIWRLVPNGTRAL